jgi:hypothetical protein
MLCGFFDDSGTHVGSRVVTWGGVLGDIVSFVDLERRWKPLLMQPLEGKPQIKQFHAAHVNNAWGEFSEYRPAERDLTTKVFRDCIIASQLVPVSFSVLVDDWAACTTPEFRLLYRSPEHFAFMSCVLAAHRMASIGDAPVLFVFDQARLIEERDPINAAVQDLFKDSKAELAYEPCAAQPGLQAADMIAYEANLLANSRLTQASAPREHFQRLLEGAPEAYGFVLAREQIERLVAYTHHALEGGHFEKSGRAAGFQNLFSFEISGGLARKANDLDARRSEADRAGGSGPAL